MAKQGPIIRNTNKRNKQGTDCNDERRVVVGMHPSDNLPYSLRVKKSVSNYIYQYDLKCSLLAFPHKINWTKFLNENKLYDEFLDAFASYLDWAVVCRKFDLSEPFMERYADRMNWTVASQYQDFSKEFIFKHQKRLDMYIIKNVRFLITQDELNAMAEKDKKMKTEEKVDNRFDLLDL